MKVNVRLKQTFQVIKFTCFLICLSYNTDLGFTIYCICIYNLSACSNKRYLSSENTVTSVSSNH